jgi:hypothetical protein
VYEESAPIGVGTIEMRIYVLRRSGDRHNPSDLTKYYECEGEGHDTDRPIGYELIAPDYAVTFNKDRPEVESRLARKVRRSWMALGRDVNHGLFSAFIIETSVS